MTDVAMILGTRPEIIKLSPVIREFDRRDAEYVLVHTGQHYSENLDRVFFDQLELPTPEYNLEVGSGHHGQQTAEMIAGIEEILLDESPDTVLVQGDTNSVLAGAIVSSKLETDLGHVEAGLRSYSDIPEESNRIVADHVSDYLFAPTAHAEQNLYDEGLPRKRVVVTGNTVVDAVNQHRSLAAEKSSILADLDLADAEYGLMTAHRADNVDDEGRFAGILDGASRVADAFDLEVVYPIHPRGRKRLNEFDLDVGQEIHLVDPLDYLDFLKLQQNASLVLTDSGGVQEESCILGVPCVTLRDQTERPETIEVGANCLAGADPDEVLSAAEQMIDRPPTWTNPFGDGEASEQIYEVLSGSREVIA